MKAVVVEHPGGPEVLTLKEVPLPEVKDGWSLIKIKGFGINHSEVFTRQGLSPSVTFPRILGIECVGEIEESTTPTLEKGQKVVSIMGEMGRAFDGSYAEYVLLPNDQIYPVETIMDWQSLVTLPETYYTAFVAFNSLKVENNDRILVRGGTSGVGISFLNIVRAKFPNLEIYGTTRNVDKEDILLKVGFNQVILEEEGCLQTDETFDKVLELIGPATIKDSLKHTEEGGIVCSCGQLGGQWFLEEFDPIMELQGNRYLTTAYSGRVSLQSIQSLIDYVEKYRMNIVADRIFSLETVSEAHRLMESGKGFGKNIVLL